MNTLAKENLDEIFKSYDIRGEVPSQLDEAFFKALGKGYAAYLDAKTVAIGRDFRPDSKDFQKAFIDGILETGCNVVNIGEVATEMSYFAAGEYPDRFDGAAIITASHNPAGWNGCKMVGKNASGISGNKGLPEIKQHILDKSYKESETKGTETQEDIFEEYKKKVLSFLDESKIKQLKVVVDAGNGIGGVFFEKIFGELPIEIIPMYFEPDGSFPNHVPDPTRAENLVDVTKRTVGEQADIGIAIDGDADRVIFIDNKGKVPTGKHFGTVLVKKVLGNLKTKNEKVIHGPRIVKAIRAAIQDAGGIPVINPVGHTLFKERMKQENAVLGIEMSAHIFYRDFYYADSAMVTIANMLQMLSEGLDFDEEMEELFEKYPDSGEVNYQVDNVDTVLDRIEKEYSGQEIDKLDGITVKGDKWRFNVRPSNTQPLLRVNLEADTKEIVAKEFVKLEKIISGKRDNIPTLPALQKALKV